MENELKLNGMYKGVVEDNKDPKKLGRCRIRILGVHSPLDSEMSTNNLPWAEQSNSLFISAESGFGVSTVPAQGTWVWCFFEQGYPNLPVYFGKVQEFIEEVPSKKYMFRDPDEIYPDSNRINESEMNRLSRAEKLNLTIHNKINTSLDTISKSDSTSGADVSQTEPESTDNKVKYPNNTVIESKSGHIIEIDDTKDNERIRLYHKTGTYLEIKPDGSIVTKSKGNTDHIIREGDLEEHIKKGVKSYIENNLEQIIGQNFELFIQGNMKFHIGGTTDIISDGNMKLVAPRIDLNP